MNNIKTWTQGKFIYSNKYKHWTFEEKERAKYEELLRVRPGLKDNHICVCNDPEDAKWIASRLNLASELEQLTYDYATGKTDGTELIKFVLDKVKG